MKLKLAAVMAFSAVLLVTGCGHGGKGQKAAVEEPVFPSYEKSQSVTADIYLDGTTSMYGYVNYPGGTIYGDAVKGIERSVTENWKDDTIHYVKFGNEYKTMNRDEFLQMDKPAFYDQTDTSLQNVVEQADGNHLNVIVTDLFQTNQDLDSLVQAIKNKGFATDNAVAVIGIKSQFNGKIFDVGKNMSSLDYASNDDPSSYRPFYLLIFGKENDTRAFVQNYIKKLPKDGQAGVAFLSANMGTNPLLEADKVSNKKGDKKEKTAKLAAISNLLPNNDIMQYRLKKDEKVSEGAVRFYGKDVIGKIPDTYTLVTDSVEANNKGTFETAEANNFIEGSADEAGLNNGTANIPLVFQVSPSAVHKKDGIYRAKLSLIPDKESYLKAVNVFSDWNFEDSQIGDSPESLTQVGGKTLNISKFVELLGSMNYELNKPGFHDIYMYFEMK